MPLHNLSTLIHTKTTTLTLPSKPAATISPSPYLRRLKSFFTVRMIEDCGGIFGLVSPWPWDIGRLLHSPNIVGDFGYGWVFWQHGRKLRKACARMLLMTKLLLRLACRLNLSINCVVPFTLSNKSIGVLNLEHYDKVLSSISDNVIIVFMICRW